MVDIVDGKANVWAPEFLSVVSSNTKRVEENIVATEGQFIFQLTTFAYAPKTGSLAVYKNGLLLIEGTDWNEQTATTFGLVEAATAGDDVTAVGFTEIQGFVPEGTFLPLAGGVMDIDALLSWNHATEPGTHSFRTHLGMPAFLWSPTNVFGGEVGFSMAPKLGFSLDYNMDGRGSPVLTGRGIAYSDLAVGDLITKGDTQDMFVNSLSWNHQVDVSLFGAMLAEYKSTTLATLPGGQALIFDNGRTNVFTGFIFTTGGTDGSEYNVELAGGQVWMERTQNDTTNAPLANSLVTRSWVENFGPASGTIGEAPIDGTPYSRQDAGWVASGGGAGSVTLGSNIWTTAGVQTYTKLGGGTFDGTMEFTNLFGIDVFNWTPANPAAEDIGFVWTCNNTVNAVLTHVAGMYINGQIFTDDRNVVTVGHMNPLLDDKADADDTVDLTTAQTVAGAKTFSSVGDFSSGLTITGNVLGVGLNISANLVVQGLTTAGAQLSMNNTKILLVANGTASTDGVNKGQLDAKADDSVVMKLTGNQSASGEKTFNSIADFAAGMVITGNLLGVGLNVSANAVVQGLLTVNSQISMTGTNILNMADGVFPDSAATKGQVDAAAPAGWQVAIATIRVQTNGAAGVPTILGTPRGCTAVAYGGGAAGQFLVRLVAQTIASANNVEAYVQPGPAVFATTSAMSVVSTTDILVALQVSGTATDGACTVRIYDQSKN